MTETNVAVVFHENACQIGFLEMNSVQWHSTKELYVSFKNDGMHPFKEALDKDNLIELMNWRQLFNMIIHLIIEIFNWN